MARFFISQIQFIQKNHMRSLYPELSPNHTYSLDVGNGHILYVEESGNPSGLPVVFIHGGPGGGSTEKHRRYFKPESYRIINFDQRGAHRSKPGGEVESNTTGHLIDDLDSIRKYLNIDSWLLFGGSWGATLALLYAESYPDHVNGMILRGSFLARRADLSWFSRDGAGRLLPEHWEKFSGHPGKSDQDLVSHYHQLIHGQDESAAMLAAKSWAEWNARVVTYLIFDGAMDSEPDSVTLNNARIETHYAYHNYFIEENQILAHIDRIPNVPVRIIHGKRDITCTPDSSWALHRNISQSEIQMVLDGGHLASDKAICDALIQATDAFITLIQ